MTDSAATSRGRGRPPIELDESLLATAAAEAFVEGGFLGTRVDDIAERAGVTRSLLFRRFQSKDALFAWTLDHEVTLLTEHLFSAYERADQLDIAGALQAGFGAIVDYAMARPHGFVLVFQPGRHVGSSATPPTETVRSLITDRVEEMVRWRLAEQDRPSGPAAAVIASAIVGAGEHAGRRCIENRELDPAAVSSLLAEVFAVGFAGVQDDTLEAANGPVQERQP